MKAIMISIKPEWNEKILNREKTLEIRTTCPKEWNDYFIGKTTIKPEPITVYDYCTKDNKNYLNRKDYHFCYMEKRDVLGVTDKVRELFDNVNGFYERLNGKVVAQFTLKNISYWQPYWTPEVMHICDISENSCVSRDDLVQYCRNKIIYAWHIDDLIIYDKPKELSDFTKVLDCKYCIDYNRMDSGAICPDCINANILKRPPQSWCYVEEIGEEVW